jgi:predicted outer membrane protein
MDIDPIKAPRTYAAWKKSYDVQELAKFMVELSQQLEIELNTAIVNEAIAENKVYMLEKQLKEAQDRIKRLEEAGDMMVQHFYTDEPRSEMWDKAKEAKL